MCNSGKFIGRYWLIENSHISGILFRIPPHGWIDGRHQLISVWSEIFYPNWQPNHQIHLSPLINPLICLSVNFTDSSALIIFLLHHYDRHNYSGNKLIDRSIRFFFSCHQWGVLTWWISLWSLGGCRDGLSCPSCRVSPSESWALID